MVTSAVAQAQEKVEGANFDLRKHFLDYDDVLNKQRSAVYKRRQEFLSMLNKEDIARTITDAAYAHLEAAWMTIVSPPPSSADTAQDPPLPLRARIAAVLKDAALIKDESELPPPGNGREGSAEDYRALIERKSVEIAENPLARNQLLGILDMLWMTNLEDLEALQESVGLRAYGQRDPLVEYRHEASRLFRDFWHNFNGMVFANAFKLAGVPAGGSVSANPNRAAFQSSGGGAHSEKIGRNDPCPCGSGKKYKHCGLENTDEHKK